MKGIDISNALAALEDSRIDGVKERESEDNASVGAETPALRRSRFKVWAAAAACLAFAVAAISFTAVYTAKARKYGEAVSFFKRNGLYANGLTRDEVIDIYLNNNVAKVSDPEADPASLSEDPFYMNYVTLQTENADPGANFPVYDAAYVASNIDAVFNNGSQSAVIAEIVPLRYDFYWNIYRNEMNGEWICESFAECFCSVTRVSCFYNSMKANAGETISIKQDVGLEMNSQDPERTGEILGLIGANVDGSIVEGVFKIPSCIINGEDFKIVTNGNDSLLETGSKYYTLITETPQGCFNNFTLIDQEDRGAFSDYVTNYVPMTGGEESNEQQ